MKKRPETMEELIEALFEAQQTENELHIMYLEARLHREADWIIPGTIRG